MNLPFTKKTFTYFDGARRNNGDRAWFDAHRELYTEHVELPFHSLVHQLRQKLAPLLPGIAFTPSRIAKPLLRQKAGSEGPVLRPNAAAHFAEQATSMFESNPGIYISIGSEPDQNVMGCGLYEPSARQLRELRPRFYSDHAALSDVLKAKPLRKHWGGLSGALYQRFPKGCDPDAPGAAYVRQKQFFLGTDLSRDEIIDAAFAKRVVEAMAAAVPFLTWTRAAVGVYKRPSRSDNREI